MLKLTNIKKNYRVADSEVEALKGVSLCFRKNEFVSILGPSGCGKTTLLNIIGGLDKYTSGDLFINGRSTKEYTDRDWDIYRNHRIGFIFQSYNLIPHQTILGNVELALTISGISKQERIERAKCALDRVGLSKQYNKKPNQLSGGQCQRVAIARALVNEPEILLADEPTGALDTETSIQIMELIKGIAKEKLVIMVTHNPDLAFKYSTRIVRLLDGEVIEDSNPFSPVEEAIEAESNNQLEAQALKDKPKEKEKAKMSFLTAFRLSARNLLSKRGRSLLVCLAGAIGIIGVSSVLSVSRGVKDYIIDMQDDMLSGNPIQIGRSGVDMATLMTDSSLMDKAGAMVQGDFVNVNQMIQYLIGHQDVLLNLQYNNEFNKQYVDYIKSMPGEYYKDITLNYGLDFSKSIYTSFTVSDYPGHPGYSLNREAMSLDAITETYTKSIEEMPEYGKYATLVSSLTSGIMQSIPNTAYINQQYDVLNGRLPESYNEILVVLDPNSSLTDLAFAQLGYYSQDDFFNLVEHAMDPANSSLTDDDILELSKFTFEDIMNKKFTWYPNDVIFTKTTIDNEPFRYNYLADNFDKSAGISLNIVGIVKPKKGISYGALDRGFLVTEEFARKTIEINHDSEINKYIKSRNQYKEDDEFKSLYKDAFLQLDKPLGDGHLGYDLEYYWKWLDDSGVKTKFVELNNRSYQDELLGYFGAASGVNSMTLRSLGGDYMPASIKIYPLDFENKHLVTDYLDAWNGDSEIKYNVFDDNFEHVIKENVILSPDSEFRTNIRYMDNVEVVINMMNQMIDIITYALIAFTALALLVSCVMIAIITYVSVMERIKEIGVIRSLGGRKRDVSNLFNAETCMIGLMSGLIGVGVTGLIGLIANMIVSHVSGGTITVISRLTWSTTGIMLLISVALTVISGLIPALGAAKKDPVTALRSE